MSRTESPSSPGDVAERVRRVAREVYDLAELRPGQLDAVAALVRGRDALVVMPTGSGKSAVYQIAARLLPGPTLVISPLIALQRDQVLDLRSHQDAGGAVTVHSSKPRGQRAEAVRTVREGGAEFLFLAPEQLAKPAVLASLRAARPSLVAIDEAHCVSQWGHDFRPDYLRLGGVVADLGHPPVAALTATAAPPVRAEIAERLGLRDPAEVVLGFDRPNIFLAVHSHGDADTKRSALVDWAAQEARGAAPGIVYAARRRDTETYAHGLAGRGLRAAAYHAGMRKSDRDRTQRAFMDGDLDAVAATSAFGMGIDKPDVRFVVHADIPESIDAYYQQIGRSGRDGGAARAVLFYRPGNVGLQRFLVSNHPREDDVRLVAEVLWRRPDMGGRELRVATGLPARRLTRIANLLDDARARPARSAAGLADEALRIAHDHQEMERSRLEMMRAYAEMRDCRRQFLLNYFGETLPDRCGWCDNCRAGAAGEQPSAGRAPFPAGAVVRHRDWGDGTVIRAGEDRIVVLFDRVGYKELSLDVVRHTDVLDDAEVDTR